MILCQYILCLLVLILGLIGLVGCIAAMVGIWIVNRRMRKAADNVFGTIDGFLVAVQERVVQMQDRVEASRLTAEGIEKTLKDWAEREASRRLALLLHATENAKKLGSILQHADHWLEVTEDSIELVQQALSMGRLKGVPMDTPWVDRLIEEIASLRMQLAEATEFVTKIDEYIAEASEKKPLEERIEQAVQLAFRVVATLGLFDSLLEKFENRLSETRKKVHGLESKMRRWILIITVGLTFLMVWMAAGQAALCLLAWNSLH